MRAILTPDDLKKGDLAEVGWHPIEIVNYTEEIVTNKEAKNPGSTNCIFEFKIFDGPNKGIAIKKYYNEAALGFTKKLLVALKVPMVNGGYELSTELFKSMIGAKLKGYIKHGVSDKGNKFNDLEDFLPLS